MRRRLRFLLILALLAPAPPALAIHVGHIQGHVYDETGKPIAGARVTVYGPDAVGTWKCDTDKGGFYRIAGLDASRELSLTVEAPGRTTIERSGYRLRDDQTVRLSFTLRPVGIFHTLVITDPRIPYHHQALAGARSTLPPGVRVFEAKRDSRGTARKLERALAARPDGILAIGSLPAHLARKMIFDIPVVYTMVLDPRKENLLASNMCGIAANGAFSEQLDILQQMAPSVKRIGTIFDPERMDGVVRQVRDEAAQMGYELEARAVHEPRDLETHLVSLQQAGVEALVMLLDPGLWTIDVFQKVRAFAQERNMIFIVPDGAMVRAGATFSYGPGFEELGAYAGRLLANVVGKKVTTSEIGVIFPSTRYFSVNPQDVDRFGLRMPATVINAAPAPIPEMGAGPGK